MIGVNPDSIDPDPKIWYWSITERLYKCC